MPIHYNPQQDKWYLDLTEEENLNLHKLMAYLQVKVGDVRNFVDKNNRPNTVADLRFYNDDDFYNS